MTAPQNAMTVAEKQRVLADGPVGRWQTVAGTADALMRSQVQFHADGTGSIVSQSVLSGEEKMAFRWTMRGKGTLALRDAEVPEGPDEWELRQLVFRPETTDLGEIEVLGEQGGDGFWFLLSPLGYVGDDTNISEII